MQLVTLRFDGTMEPRGTPPSAIKGKLYVAEAGDLVFSKIDIRNGAIGIVPEAMPIVALTSEFPVYKIRPGVALPGYITLLLRTSFFQQTINSMISGASGRKRVQPTELEAIDVPLPPIDVQQSILTLWEVARATTASLLATAEKTELDALQQFQRELGLLSRSRQVGRKTFALNWSAIDRWGVEQARRASQKAPDHQYPTQPIRSICQTGSGGTPSRKIARYYEQGTIPWVKTTEVRGNIIEDTEEKITQEGLDKSAAKIYPPGSLVVAMYGQGATRGRTAKLGIHAATNQACCVLFNFHELVDPDYVWYFLMSEYDRLREQASGNNQPNLNAEMIGSYQVPIPPRKIQRELVSLVEAARQRASAARADALLMKSAAERDLELTILGHGITQSVKAAS